MEWEFGLIAPLAFQDGAEGDAHWSYCATNARRSPRAAGWHAATRCEGRRFRLPTSHRRSGRPIQTIQVYPKDVGGLLRAHSVLSGGDPPAASRPTERDHDAPPFARSPAVGCTGNRISRKISLLLRTCLIRRPLEICWITTVVPQRDRPTASFGSHRYGNGLRSNREIVGRSCPISEQFRSAPRTG